MPAIAYKMVGLRETQRALIAYGGTVNRELRKAIMEAAEPVRDRAQTLAVAEISHIGDQWSRMRIGVTQKVVYVAPKSRRHGGSPRKNLAPLLMNQAMEPALEEEGKHVEEPVRALLDITARRYGF